MEEGSVTRAIGVIDIGEAGSRARRYKLNMARRAVELGFDLAEVVELRDGKPVREQLLAARDRHRATVVIVPSVRHLAGVERQVTEWADIYAVGRSRVYRRGHIWPSSAEDAPDAPPLRLVA